MIGGWPWYNNQLHRNTWCTDCPNSDFTCNNDGSTLHERASWRETIPGAKIHTLLSRNASSNQNFKEIIGKVKTAFSLKSTQLGILLSLLYPFHFLIPLLPLLFLRELDWSQERFNATKGGLVLIITMFGYLAEDILQEIRRQICYHLFNHNWCLLLHLGLTESWWGRNSTLYSSGH